MLDINPFEALQNNETLGSITDALQDPRVQSALLSGGAQLAQPLQWGQSQFGHLMSSLGQAGEGVRNVDEQQRKDTESDSKNQLRESSAQLAEARARNTGVSAEAAQDRLALRREQEDRHRDAFHIGEQRRWLSNFETERNRIRHANKAVQENLTLKPEEKAKLIRPEPTLTEYLANAPPTIRDLFKGPTSDAGSDTKPSTSKAVRVSTPDEARALPAGTRYITPDGQEYTR